MRSKAFIALFLPLAGGPLTASEIYSTSFEADDPIASYKAGVEINARRPYLGWSAMDKGSAEILTGQPGGLVAPEGEQFLRMKAGSVLYLHHAIAPSGHTLQEPFRVSALIRFQGSASPDSPVVQIAVTNWDKQAIHAGLQFGILHEGGTYRFFWNLTREKHPERVPFGEGARPDTVYRLEADIDPASGTAALRAYDHATGELAGEASHTLVYRGRPTPGMGFNILRIHHNPDMSVDLDAIKVALIVP